MFCHIRKYPMFTTDIYHYSSQKIEHIDNISEKLHFILLDLEFCACGF